RGPHDVAYARPLACRDAGEVPDEGGVPLAVPVRARLLVDDRLGPEAVLFERLVHALDEVWNPADPALDQHEVELRMPREDAREDERRYHLTDRDRRDRDEGLLHARGGVLEDLGDVLAARADDVEAHREPGLLDQRPEGLVGGIPECPAAPLVREG